MKNDTLILVGGAALAGLAGVLLLSRRGRAVVQAAAQMRDEAQNVRSAAQAAFVQAAQPAPTPAQQAANVAAALSTVANAAANTPTIQQAAAAVARPVLNWGPTRRKR